MQTFSKSAQNIDISKEVRQQQKPKIYETFNNLPQEGDTKILAMIWEVVIGD